MGTKAGNTKYIESPERLKELFKEYVQHERDNPMYKTEYVGKDGRIEKTPMLTPITFEGFEDYLAEREIINDLGDYSKNKENRYTEYAPIIAYIRNHCFVYNFKGAAVKLFDPNLIARKLGIKDGTDVTTGGDKLTQPITVKIVGNGDAN
jgi:hypothetical protein